MKIVKRAAGLILMLTMVLYFTACNSNNTVQNSEGAMETGAWAINDQKLGTELPDEVNAAFQKALEGFTGSTLEPVAYVGSQVVAGMNYMILCRASTTAQEPVTSYKMAVIYADLDGNARITSLTDFNFVEFTEGSGSAQEILSGGWFVPEDAEGSDIPDSVEDVFEQAEDTANWEWDDIDILAYLGNQIVSGTNYAFLCEGELDDDSTGHILVVTVYEDLEGTAEISNVYELDLSSFNDQ